jgi:hypothetical protein
MSPKPNRDCTCSDQATVSPPTVVAGTQRPQLNVPQRQWRFAQPSGLVKAEGLEHIAGSRLPKTATRKDLQLRSGEVIRTAIPGRSGAPAGNPTPTRAADRVLRVCLMSNSANGAPPAAPAGRVLARRACPALARGLALGSRKPHTQTGLFWAIVLYSSPPMLPYQAGRQN